MKIPDRQLYPDPVTAFEFGQRCARNFADMDRPVTDFRWMFDNRDGTEGTWEDFCEGFNGFRPCTHFVGFRGEEFWSAVRVWGRPDFTHRHWDRRVPGDVAPGDTVVFARGTDQDPFVPFVFNDSDVDVQAFENKSR
jgi:hypothetical protein